MDNVTQFLPPDIGGGPIWPGLIMPAAFLLVALLSAAAVIFLTSMRGAGGEESDDSGPVSGA
jgi:hypothetical protein